MARPHRRRKWLLVLLPLALIAAGVLGILARESAMLSREDRRIDKLATAARAALTPGLSADQAVQWLESRGLPHSGVIDTAPSPDWSNLPGFCPYVIQAGIPHRHRSILRPVERDLTVVIQLDKDRVVQGVRIEEVLTGP